MIYHFMLLHSSDHPSGGINQIYRIAEVMEKAGKQTDIVYNLANYKFAPEKESPIKSMWVNDFLVKVKPEDILILPEFNCHQTASNTTNPYIILCQGGHEAWYGRNTQSPNYIDPFLSEKCMAVWCVSKHSKELLLTLYPELEGKIELLNIDMRLSDFPEITEKKDKLCFYPKKCEKMPLYIPLLENVCNRNNVEFRILDNLTRKQFLEELAESKYFVYLSCFESNSMPIVEAILSKCSVYGNSGNAFCMEYNLPIWKGCNFTATNDPIALYNRLFRAMSTGEYEFCGKQFDEAGDFIRNTYNAEQLEKTVLAALEVLNDR